MARAKNKKDSKPMDYAEEKKPRSPATVLMCDICTLTICGACRIRLVVRESESTKCRVCGSPDIKKELWKREKVQ